jgi:glycerate 2-kinase
MNQHMIEAQRKRVLELYAQALQAVDARWAMIQYLKTYPLKNQRYRLIAIGKAAATMAQGVWETSAMLIERGLVITPAGAPVSWHNPPADIEWLESTHPIPDERSLAAGQRLLEFIQTAASDIPFIFLISGGTSALVEVLPAKVSLAELQRLNHWLLANAKSIDEMNRLRKAVSQIKGGRLATILSSHAVEQYLISDVPGDRPTDIGSGLLIAADSDQLLPAGLPEWLMPMLRHAPALPTASTCSAQVLTHIIASNAQARAEVIHSATQDGMAVCCDEQLSGDAITLGRNIAQRVIAGAAGVYVFGGETVVTLPASPGRGGRCQSLALAAAQQLQGHNDIVLLAASTDGSDGSSGIAGALVDGATCTRGQQAGLDAELALQQANAGGYLEETGDLIDTGPTGTNVMDVVIALKTQY